MAITGDFLIWKESLKLVPASFKKRLDDETEIVMMMMPFICYLVHQY